MSKIDSQSSKPQSEKDPVKLPVESRSLLSGRPVHGMWMAVNAVAGETSSKSAECGQGAAAGPVLLSGGNLRVAGTAGDANAQARVAAVSGRRGV